MATSMCLECNGVGVSFTSPPTVCPMCSGTGWEPDGRTKFTSHLDEQECDKVNTEGELCACGCGKIAGELGEKGELAQMEKLDGQGRESPVDGQGRERLNHSTTNRGLRPTRSYVGHYKKRATRCLHNHPENKIIGANLLYLRELAGFSQAEVWKILKKRGIATLSCLESGQFHRVEPLLLHRMLVLYEADMLTLGHLMDPNFIKNRQKCPPKKSLETLARQGRKK